MSKLYLAKSKISNDETITDVIISLDKVCSLRLCKEKNYYIIIDTVSDDQIYMSFDNELDMRNELKKILNHMSNDGHMADEINCVN